MKPIFSLSVLAIISLAFLSSCASGSGTGDSVVSITPIRSSPSTTTSSASQFQQRNRGGRGHDSVTPEIKSISTGISTTNTDGTTTIQKEVSYVTPAGTMITDFTLTTDSSGVVTAVRAVYDGNDHEDLMYHNRFNSSSSSQIVGKNIKSLSLRAVGGASLTTDAFNKMVASL